MAALKLITLGDRPLLRIQSSQGATCCHCPPFTHAEMAALELITSSSRFSPRISSSNGSTHCHALH
eukprot:4651166-Karenia_brevis.AAC.1